LAGAPILVENLGAVFGGNRRHTLSVGEMTGWSGAHPENHDNGELSVFPGRGIFAPALQSTRLPNLRDYLAR
jgi:hypothetical protein